MLTNTFGLDPERVLLVERGNAVGETFRRWPKEMRFISPSFNQQGWTKSFDLNSVFHGTSPAFSLHAEHPTGEQYATYLSTLAEVRKKERKKQYNYERSPDRRIAGWIEVHGRIDRRRWLKERDKAAL